MLRRLASTAFEGARDLGFTISHATKKCSIVGQPVGPFAMNQYVVSCNETKVPLVVHLLLFTLV